MNVMVTGGAGYIGSHAVQRLLREGHTVVAVDNLVRGHAQALDRLQPESGGRLTFEHADTGDTVRMASLLRDHGIDTIMHFAALAYVGESVTEPLRYYEANTAAALALIGTARKCGVQRFVFSSTCATYGEPSAEHIPIAETCPQSPINPYGRSKLMVEKFLFDEAHAAKLAGEPFGFAALRYFNVAGSDQSGVLGEDHHPETHLIPVVLQAALGRREKITIFGTDYPTPDGTCIRDYVNVEDLVDAHVVVMSALQPGDTRTYNLGIGQGYSVREIIDAVRRVTGRDFTVDEGERRPGDPPELFANPSKIADELGWRASRTDLDATIASAYRWFEANPNGYAG